MSLAADRNREMGATQHGERLFGSRICSPSSLAKQDFNNNSELPVMNQPDQLDLCFGVNSTWTIEHRASIASYLVPNGGPLQDLPGRVSSVLANPVEFPSLDQALVPGDSLVLAVDPVLPSVAEVLECIVDWFIAHGTSPSNVSVVVAGSSVGQAASADLIQAKFSSRWNEISIELHDPDDPNKIAYVAANEDAEPIYMNRTLVDADVVVPVTCCRAKHALDYLGAYGLYPLLSDRKTMGAFYNLQRLAKPEAHHKLTAWADQAAMWAGFMVEVQVVPAGRNQVGEILAGLTQPLEQASCKLMSAVWETSVATSDLTVALLDGGPSQQDWLGFARALYAADRCTRDGGAIAVCTSAKESVGRSLSRLKGNANDSVLAKKLAKDDCDDAIAAALIQEISQSKHIYLAAEMQSSSIESIGLGPLTSQDELNHLLGQFESVNVLGSAQHREVISA